MSCTKEPDKNTKTIVYGIVKDGNTGKPFVNSKVYVEFDAFFDGYFVRTDSTMTNNKGYYTLDFYGGEGGDYAGDMYIRAVHPDTVISTNYLAYSVEGSAIQKPIYGGINEINFVLY